MPVCVCVTRNRGQSDQDTEDLKMRVNYTAGEIIVKWD